MARTKKARKTVARPTKKPRAKKPEGGDRWTETRSHASAYPEPPGTGELQVEIQTYADEAGKRQDHFGLVVSFRHWPDGADKIKMVDGDIWEIPVQFLDALPAAIAAAIATGRRAGCLPPAAMHG